jgi:tellurite resistance protein TehA-like permease
VEDGDRMTENPNDALAGTAPAPHTATASTLEPLPAGRVASWLATLDAGYFAAVMATGIVSIGAGLLGQTVLALVLLWVTAAAFVILLAAYLARAARFPHRFAQSLREPGTAVSYFTVVAGTNVLATGLVGRGLWPLALGMGIAAFVIWLALTYGLFCSIVLAGNRPLLREITGVWLVWVVGTQSIAVLAASLAPHLPWSPARRAAGDLAVVFWGVGVVLYLILVVIIFLRLFLIETTPKEMGPAYWILMGATAISVRAAAGILSLSQTSPDPMITGMHPFILGLAVVLWSFGSWFIPMLVLFGLWRYFVRGYSWGYEPKLWSVVFPLGMYTVASYTLGETADIGFMASLAQAWVWIGVAAWFAVTGLLLVAFVGSLRTRQASR